MDGPAEVRRCAALCAIVYGAMGASGITGQAINSLTKDTLALTPARAALFMALATSPSYLGPVIGLLSDAVPLFGTRRKAYLALAGLAGAAAWLALGALAAPRFAPALLLLMAGTLCLTAQTTVANGLMVDVGRPQGQTGLLQSVQWGAANLLSLATMAASGYLVERSGGAAAFRLYAAFPLAVGCAALALMRDPRVTRSRERVRAAVRTLFAASASRSQWAVALLLFAWFFSPGLGTALYYYQRDSLRFEPGFIGVLGAVFAAAGLPAAAAFGGLSRRLSPRRLMAGAAAAGTIGHLGYLLVSGTGTAAAAYAIDGALSLFAMLALFDIGARMVPDGAEGAAFSVLTSARVLAILAGGVVGAWLYQTVGLHALIVIGAAFTAACGLFCRWLPDDAPDHTLSAAAAAGGHP